MSKTTWRCCKAQSSLKALAERTSTYRLPLRCLRPFSGTSRRRVDDDPTKSSPPTGTSFSFPSSPRGKSAPQATSPSLHPKAASGGMSDLASAFNSFVTKNQNQRDQQNRRRRTLLDNISDISSIGDDGSLIQKADLPYRLHIYATRHNIHITIARPPGYVNLAKKDKPVSNTYTPVMSFSAGNIGFRHSARKHYDSAFQLASYVMSRMQEAGINAKIRNLEVYLRGFGAGREAVTKALLGTEGRHLRGKVVKVSDATRLKFGGTRSKKPRRLG